MPIIINSDEEIEIKTKEKENFITVIKSANDLTVALEDSNKIIKIIVTEDSYGGINAEETISSEENAFYEFVFITLFFLAVLCYGHDLVILILKYFGYGKGVHYIFTTGGPNHEIK